MRQTRHITHGAMTVALTAIIVLIDRLFQGFFMPFMALPLIVYGYNYGLKNSAIVSVSNIILSFILSGRIEVLVSGIGYSLIGLSYIYARKEEKSKKVFYMIMSLAVGIFYLIMITFFSEYFGFDFTLAFQQTKEYFPTAKTVIVHSIIYGIIFLMILMEVYIIKMSADMTIYLLSRNRNR